jgi:hypothetical protein
MPAVFYYIERGRRWMIEKVGSKLISGAKEKSH